MLAIGAKGIVAPIGADETLRPQQENAGTGRQGLGSQRMRVVRGALT